MDWRYFDRQYAPMQRNLAVAALVSALAGHATPAFSQAPLCLPYEPEKVVLIGTVRRALAYGPPGYGETPSRDAKQIFYSLELSQPICVLAGDDPDQPGERSIRQVQIAFIQMPFDKSLPEKRVRITGTLFEGRPTTWDAPVSRVEAGAGYSFRRNFLLKIAVQRNWRTGVPPGSGGTLRERRCSLCLMRW